MRKILTSTAKLDFLPERYQRVLTKKTLLNIFRRLIVDNFIVIYQVDIVKNEVYILHIFHRAQNYLRFL